MRSELLGNLTVTYRSGECLRSNAFHSGSGPNPRPLEFVHSLRGRDEVFATSSLAPFTQLGRAKLLS